MSNTNTNTEKINNKNNIDVTSDQPSYNQFYDYISVIYRVFSFIFVIAFLLYIIFSAYYHAESFSYENFDYVLRNFALTLEENKDDTLYSIQYNPDANQSYALFGEGVAVCGNFGLFIYSATGRLTCSESFSYKTPRMASSDKFVIVYDLSNSEYSIYNSFNRVSSEQSEENIYNAAVADNGYYALITSSQQYNTAVELYDDNLSLINRFNKIGYAVDIDIDDKYLLIITAVGSGGNAFATDVQVFDIVNKQEAFVTTEYDNFPLACSITSVGFTVIGTKYVSFYDFSGELINTYSYDGKVPYDFAINNASAAIIFKEEGFDLEYSSIVLDESGTVKYEYDLYSTVIDIEICGKWSCYLTEDHLICTDGETIHKFDLDKVTEKSKLLSLDNGSVYVCTDSAAPLINLP